MEEESVQHATIQNTSIQHNTICEEIDDLRKQQSEARTDATFLGWTAETAKAHQLRSDRMANLRIQLDVLDAGPDAPATNVEP